MFTNPKPTISRLLFAASVCGLCTSVPYARAADDAGNHDGSPRDTNLLYIGRWDKTDPHNYLSYWGGAYVGVRFNGTSVALQGNSTSGGPTFMVSLDGQALHEVREFKVEGLKAGEHDLIFGAPSQNAEVSFRGLQLSKDATTLPIKARPIIEFIGDSITTGGGQTRPNTINYAWETAEALGADHTQIAFSGHALTSGYGCLEDKTGFDAQYFGLKSFMHIKEDPQVPWNVDYQPQMVVINLGQNDKCGSEPDSIFQASYETFIKNIRSKIPEAEIVALRPFGAAYEKSVRAAVESANTSGDKKVMFVDTTRWLEPADFVDGVHPSEAGHDKVAAKLVEVLKPLLP